MRQRRDEKERQRRDEKERQRRDEEERQRRKNEKKENIREIMARDFHLGEGRFISLQELVCWLKLKGVIEMSEDTSRARVFAATFNDLDLICGRREIFNLPPPEWWKTELEIQLPPTRTFKSSVSQREMIGLCHWFVWGASLKTIESRRIEEMYYSPGMPGFIQT